MKLTESLKATRVIPARKPTLVELPEPTTFDAAYAEAVQILAEVKQLTEEALALLKDP